MLKSVQIKIIIIFMVLGIVCITVLGMFFISKLQLTLTTVEANSIDSIQLIEKQIRDTKLLVLYANFIFAIISIVVGYFVSKVIIHPISNLMRIADKIDETAVQKRQIETILLKMTDGVIAFDIKGKVLHMNPAAKKMLSISDKMTSFEEIFKKLNIEINLEKIMYLENWTSYDQNVKINDKVLNMMFVPFKDDFKKPEGVIAVIQDITEQVNLDNMRKDFVANVSHELKTPITSIIGYAETLQGMGDSEEEKNKFLNVIISEANRMSVLVSDLLTLSKYETDETIKKEEFDLTEVVKNVYENLKLEAKKKKQNIECFVTANVPNVYADRFGIERVIINILNNSIKYTPENGSIKVYVGFVYNDAYIKVIDTGIGIPEEDLNRIFERFYRVDKARSRESGGTGLGLSIAKEILDRNNCTIDIKSIIDRGTEVVIKIPTVQERNMIDEIYKKE